MWEGGKAMNEREFSEKMKEARDIQERARCMIDEADLLSETDLDKATDMLLEAIGLLRKGTEIQNAACEEALVSRLMELTEEKEKQLREIK